MPSTKVEDGRNHLIKRVQEQLGEANLLCGRRDWSNESPVDDEDEERAESLIEAAFEGTLVLAEMLGLAQQRARVEEIYVHAKRNFTETKYSQILAEPYYVWAHKLGLVVDALEGAAKGGRPIIEQPWTTMEQIAQVCNAFHRAALKLKARHAGRPGFVVQDEYDVQDLLGALLETRFSDIRPEEHTPSHAGKSARMDFLLQKEATVVETKMTRNGMTDKTLGDELILDIQRYQKHPSCKALFCFVYDPEHRLKNPRGLERDLGSDFIVQVSIRPRP